MTSSDLVAVLAGKAASAERFLLGVTGPPGSGKSTLAAALVSALGARAASVPMDGFHLADEELRRLGRADRKGSPDTFDALGYVALLRRLRARDEPVVYAPRFRRELELAEAGAIAVPRDIPVVVTEGNYLLCDGAFADVRGLLDEVWYVDVDGDVRRRRLVARHVRHGRTAEEAERWVTSVDEPNAQVIAATRHRAARHVQMT